MTATHDPDRDTSEHQNSGHHTSGQHTSGHGDGCVVGVDRVERGAGRVWLCAQRSAQAQRRGRLVPESVAHPARMLPDLAAHAIATYTEPGEVVLDPMCGIGTTLVEAVRAGRRAVGVEVEPRWVRIADENLALARAEGHHADARIVRGDARALDRLLTNHPTGGSPDDPADETPDGAVEGLADGDAPALVLTSPPYGSGVHGHITNARPSDPIIKYHHHYSTTRNRANLAHSPSELGAGITAILSACARVLRPGGRVVVVARPWRHRGVLIDLPGQMTACAAAAGLVLTDRAVALLARLDTEPPDTEPDTEPDTDPPTATSSRGSDAADQPDGERGGARLVARASFFARHNLRRARAARQPVHLIAHEDVYVFTTPPTRAATGPRRPVSRRPMEPTIGERGWSQ